MRRKISSVVKTPIHNSSERKVIEFLLEGSPNVNKVRQRLKERERRELLKQLEGEFSVLAAAEKSKSEIAILVAERATDKGARHVIKRFFRRCRQLKNGTGRFAQKAASAKRRKLRLSYNEYIHSPAWTARRNHYWQTHTKRCVICTSAEYVDLHHMVYTAFDGTEPDSNLVALCHDHHFQYHEQHGSSGNMNATTLAFIDTQMQLLEFSALQL